MTNSTAIQETDKMKQQWAKHIELGVSMNKIDLIIYALELVRNEIHDPTLWTDKVDKALAAARELKALAQPEQEQSKAMHKVCIEASMRNNIQYVFPDKPVQVLKDCEPKEVWIYVKGEWLKFKKREQA